MASSVEPRSGAPTPAAQSDGRSLRRRRKGWVLFFHGSPLTYFFISIHSFLLPIWPFRNQSPTTPLDVLRYVHRHLCQDDQASLPGGMPRGTSHVVYAYASQERLRHWRALAASCDWTDMEGFVTKPGVKVNFWNWSGMVRCF